MTAPPTHAALRPGYNRIRARAWGSEAAAIAMLCRSTDRTAPDGERRVVIEDPRFGRLDVPEAASVIAPMGEPGLVRPGATAGFVRTLWADDPRKLAWSGADSAIALGPPRTPVRLTRGQLTVYSGPDALAWHRAGLPEAQVLLDRPPPIDPRPHQRPIEIDLGECERPAILVALGDHPMHIDARVFLYQLTVFESAGRAVVGVLPRGALHAATARRQCAKMHHAPRLLMAEVPTWRLLAGASGAVLFAARDEPTGGDAILQACAHKLGTPCVRLPASVTQSQRTARALVRPVLDATR